MNDPGAEKDGLGECDGEEVRFVSRKVARGVEGGLDPKLKLVNLALALSSEVLFGVTGSSWRTGSGSDVDARGADVGGVGVK